MGLPSPSRAVGLAGECIGRKTKADAARVQLTSQRKIYLGFRAQDGLFHNCIFKNYEQFIFESYKR